WPLHAPAADIARYAGTYKTGWAAAREARHQRQQAAGLLPNATPLSPAPSSIPEWQARDPQQEWARRMEVHAAMVDRMDQNIGKLVDWLKSNDQLENTILIFVSDNGASAEDVTERGLHDDAAPIGLRGSYLSFCEPWANVSNTPFRNYKLRLYEGGTATPLIVHWPAGEEQLKDWPSRGGALHHPGHLIDLFPTLANWIAPEAAEGIAFSGQPLQGVRDSNRTLYWEYAGHRALRQGNWKIVRTKESEGWELYDLGKDRAETTNLAAQHPQQVEVLATAWQAWAEQVGVFDER
ncbi:MAG: sulfatase-like hydrolase/transferase, partial [Bacteroidota bacterium]